MSRLLPVLRHPPAVTATATALPLTTIASSSQCFARHDTYRRHRHERVATLKQCVGDDTRARAGATRSPPKTWEDIFISSLVAAGTCKKHRTNQQPPGKHASRYYSTARSGSAQAQEEAATGGDAQISKEEYRKLVDFYRHYGPATKEAESRHLPLASRLILTPEQEEAAAQLRTTQREHQAAAPDDYAQSEIIEKFSNQILWSRLGHVCLDGLWELYQQINSPRPRYLRTPVLHRFLQHLGFVEQWQDMHAMRRYFQLLDDCVDVGVPLNKNNWTTAISFAGRWVTRTTSSEVQAAIETWMRMEEQGHSADHVTLNVLFDVAVKAGRFALADTIYTEIKARDLPLDRYFRGSLIYFGGMKRNGDEVRRAFREFVEAGEIVDTTLMNSVIVSLLRAGEAPAAEQVFSKMKRLTEEKMGGPMIEEWQERKELRSELNVAARHLRDESESHGSSFFGASFSTFDRREQVQKITPVAPDALTYTILLKYHSIVSGDADRVWELLNEMGERGLQPDARGLVPILKGFCVHSGYALSGWTHDRLEEFWKFAVRQVEVDVATERLARSKGVNQTAAPESDAQPRPALDSPAVEEDVPTLQIEDDHEWGLDDGSMYDDVQPNNKTSQLSFGGSITEGDMRHSTSRSSRPSITDDFDMLGAMLSAPTAETGNTTSHSDPGDLSLQQQPHEVQPASQTSRAPTSFLESVSLRHLTDAALLPEGGSVLDHDDGPSQKEPVEKIPHQSDATSSFLDSLIPESGDPSGQVDVDGGKTWVQAGSATQKMFQNSDQGEQTGDAARRGLCRRVPAVNSQLVNQPDDFNSFPLWRRGSSLLHEHKAEHRSGSFRDDTGTSGDAAQVRPRPSLGLDHKPIRLPPNMALEAVRAFYQCCGRIRMIQVWEEIAGRWYNGTEKEWTQVENEVAQIERHARRYEDWDKASQ